MEYSTGVPVSKITLVKKGIGNEALRRAAKKQRGSEKMSFNFLCLIFPGAQSRQTCAWCYKDLALRTFQMDLTSGSNVNHKR